MPTNAKNSVLDCTLCVLFLLSAPSSTFMAECLTVEWHHTFLVSSTQFMLPLLPVAVGLPSSLPL